MVGSRYDAVVIGAGHNGLIAAAYLARAGLHTALVEARDSVGGCASTVQAIGGRVNLCNCDHLWIRATPIVEELELERFGLRYLDLDPSYLALGWGDEQPWLQYHDIERTLEGLAATHPHQVDAYRRHVEELLPLAAMVRDVTNGVPTPRRVARIALRTPRAGAALLRLSRRSAVDALGRHFSDEELVRPALTVGPVVWGVDPSWSGTGLAALGYASKHLTPVGRPAGGSGALTDAIRAAFEAFGGATYLGHAVSNMEAPNSGTHSVHLADGTRLDAPRVVVTTDPRQLAAWSSDAAGWLGPGGSGDGYESKIDAFMSESPRYRALGRLPNPDDAQHATVLVSPSVEEMRTAHADLLAGRLSSHLMLITNTPSTLDPTLRDAHGRELLSLEVLWTPYAGADWSDTAAPRDWLRRWASLLEQSVDELVVRQRTMTPDRYETDLGLVRGHAPSFGGTPWSAVRGRPRHLTRYRTPTPGLFLAGAATYPGAGVWGAPGRNAAQVVIDDAAQASSAAV